MITSSLYKDTAHKRQSIKWCTQAHDHKSPRNSRRAQITKRPMIQTQNNISLSMLKSQSSAQGAHARNSFTCYSTGKRTSATHFREPPQIPYLRNDVFAQLTLTILCGQVGQLKTNAILNSKYNTDTKVYTHPCWRPAGPQHTHFDIPQ